ncbi:MAG: 50S ribosomal protein L20 [Candidatus Dormibacteria bacterium]
MARVKRGVTARNRHRKILRLARGFKFTRRLHFRAANEAVLHSLSYAFRDRKKRKGDMRRLWIARINAAARQNGLPYSRLMHGLRQAGLLLDRKSLADIAVRDAKAFAQIADVARKAGARQA